MKTALEMFFVGAAVVGVVSAAVLVATAMRGLFHRHHHA